MKSISKERWDELERQIALLLSDLDIRHYALVMEYTDVREHMDYHAAIFPQNQPSTHTYGLLRRGLSMADNRWDRAPIGDSWDVRTDVRSDESLRADPGPASAPTADDPDRIHPPEA